MRKLFASLVALTTATFAAVDGSADSKTSQPAPPAPALSGDAQRSLELNEQGVLALKTRNFVQAQTLFRQALDTDRHNATAAFNLAGMLITNKKEKEALPLLQEYASQFPGDASFQARLGDAYFGTQDTSDALKHYQNAFAIDPNYPNLAAKLGTIYSLQNDIPRATRMFEAATRLNPKDSQSLSNLSSLYLAQGKPTLAIASAKRAIQLQAKPETYVTLGSAYQDSKDPTNALLAFRRAQELGSKDPKLAEVISSLEKAAGGA